MSPNLIFWNHLHQRARSETFVVIKDSAFHPMPMPVTVNTKRNQIFQCIMAELTPGVQVMDFQHFCRTAILASPAIPIQNLDFEYFVAHRIQS